MLYAAAFQFSYGLVSRSGLRYFKRFWQAPGISDGAYAAVIPRWVSSLLAGESCSNLRELAQHDTRLRVREGRGAGESAWRPVRARWPPTRCTTSGEEESTCRCSSSSRADLATRSSRSIRRLKSHAQCTRCCGRAMSCGRSPILVERRECWASCLNTTWLRDCVRRSIGTFGGWTRIEIPRCRVEVPTVDLCVPIRRSCRAPPPLIADDARPSRGSCRTEHLS